MDRKTIADKLEQLYKNEAQIYANPIQTRPKPKSGITGEKPDDEDLGKEYNPTSPDDEDVTKDLGKEGSEKDLGKGSKEDLGVKKKSEPKRWDFEGPRDAVHQED